MPKRVTKIRHDENTRLKIQVAQIINRLTDHVMADVDLMTTSQVSAANILLRKALPDLSNVDHSGELEHKVTMIVTGVDRDSPQG